MKQLYLNDLSIIPLARDFHDACLRVCRFIKAFKSRPKDIFETRICSEQSLENIQLTQDLDLQSFCKDLKGRTLGTLLLGLTKHPYIDPGSIQEDQFLEGNYNLQKDDKEILAYGLAAAFLNESVGISFASEPFWDNVKFSLKDNNKNVVYTVLSVSSPSHFQSHDFLKWRDDHTPVVIIMSDIPYDQKRIHLRDDHGSDVLRSFASKLVRSPYVVEIINSLPFNPNSNSFVKAIKENGLIEVVLTWTDKGLGLVIKTTGRNHNETQMIASILQREFATSNPNALRINFGKPKVEIKRVLNGY